jgi:DNA (cytosine-5)-methyltransferase 1
MTPKTELPMEREIIVDIFAGGGGASLGISQALGVDVDLAINHDPAALMMHRANHPNTRHECSDVWEVDPVQATRGRPVGLAWFSPDCRHHSNAKGGKPRSKKIRSLAWVVLQWAAEVRPRVIILENVPEFKDWGPLNKKGRPIKRRKGETFRLWLEQLEDLGYKVQHRLLRACDWGAPTIRRRLFVMARCDGEPIVWPAPTHGPAGELLGLKPYRTAAECIDWSKPCRSIFGRKKPLAKNTLTRIARGIDKYVIHAAEPFIVRCAHGESGRGRWGRGEHPITEPLPTVTGSKDFALISPTLVQIGYGERDGQAPRVPGLDKPLGTVVGRGKHALVEAFLLKYFGGVVGADVRKPLPTVTAIDHNAIVAAFCTKFYGTNIGSEMTEPLPTVTGGGQHIGEVFAFMVKYYGTAIGQSCRQPMHTVTGKDRMGLVIVYIRGLPYVIVDIGLRMLTPRELARAQGLDDSYILTGSLSSQVSKIGNMVPPAWPRALVAANVKLKAWSRVTTETA